MIANYGYKDGSGEYFITVDTDKCTGCEKCVLACPHNVLTMIVDDYDEHVPAVTDEHRKKIKYSCAPCKPISHRKTEPCIAVCEAKAITHSW